jgi:predicted DNA binding CopG/RHH family protein
VHPTRYDGSHEVLGDLELTPDEAAEAARQIAEADRELANCVVTMRWTPSQLRLVRRAAALAGLKYQAYIREAALRRARADLRAAP